MAVNLIEAAKVALNNGETKRAAIIRIFAEASPFLARIPFVSIQGNSLAYNVEGALPGIAFRGVNEPYTPSTGVINPQTESLKIAGGELEVDQAIVKMMGPGVRSTQEAMKATAMAHQISYTMIKGDSTGNAKEFDGLEQRLTGSQLVDGSAAVNVGDVIDDLDQLMDQVQGGNALLMTKKTRRSITKQLRDAASISTARDEFGRQITFYNDMPILIADDHGDTPTLDHVEDDGGAPGVQGGTSTSIYCMHLEDGWYNAIQNGPMEVNDLGLLQSKPAFSTRVEWLVGQVVMHGRAAARHFGITVAALDTPTP